MCTLVEEYAQKKAKEAAEETARKTAIQLIKLDKLTAEEIAASVPTFSVEEITKLQESLLQIS